MLGVLLLSILPGHVLCESNRGEASRAEPVQGDIGPKSEANKSTRMDFAPRLSEGTAVRGESGRGFETRYCFDEYGQDVFMFVFSYFWGSVSGLYAAIFDTLMCRA